MADCGATWTDERVAQLKEMLAAGLSYSQMAAGLGVSRNAVAGRLRRLNGRPRPRQVRPRAPRAAEARARWDAEEDAKLRAMFGDGRTLAAIGSALGRSVDAVWNRARRLGLAGARVRPPPASRPRKSNPNRSRFNGFYSPPHLIVPPTPVSGLVRAPGSLGMAYEAYRLGRDCATILSAPGAVQKYVCGAPVQEGSSYCPWCHGRHYERVTVPLSERRADAFARWIGRRDRVVVAGADAR